MSTTPKMVRLGPRSLTIMEALRHQLNDHYSTESALLSEATRRGLLVMAVEAWHDEAGQYGGHAAKDLARLLKHELSAVFTFLLEHGEIPAMFQLPTQVMVAALASPDAGAATVRLGAAAASAEPVVTDIPIDASAIETVRLGGQDEDWDD